MPTGIYHHKKRPSIMIKTECVHCGKVFEVKSPSLVRKYCTHDCYLKSEEAKKTRETFFLNEEGVKGYWLGKKRPSMCNEKNHFWRGNEVGYRALHNWVERRLGKPMCCDFCGKTGLGRYGWANKSHEYKREITDWIRLCRKCHGEYDKK